MRYFRTGALGSESGALASGSACYNRISRDLAHVVTLQLTTLCDYLEPGKQRLLFDAQAPI
jgi:hypothetical protein